MERGRRQGAEDDSVDPLVRKCTREAQRRIAAADRASCREDADVRRQAACCELERALRRAVEPLHVVDGDDHRAPGGKGAEDAEEPHGGRSRVRLPVFLGTEQRHVEGAALRRRKLIPQLGIRRGDEIGERRVGERRFRLRGPGDENAKLAPLRTVQRLAPDRGLPDSRLAVHDQCAAGRSDSVEEPLDRTDLGVPPEDHPSDCPPRPASGAIPLTDGDHGVAWGIARAAS